MKRSLMSLAAGLSALALSFSAQAKELTFFFDVHSSGPEIYPCDAGHHQADQGQYCHYKGTSETCDPTNFGKTIGQINPGQGIKDYLGNPVDPVSKVHACICTGKNGGGYLMNFMRYKAAKWEGGTIGGDNHMGWKDATSGVATQPTAGAGVTVASKLWGTPANHVPSEFKTQLEAVTFNFGSELYGANFFVDFCYRGPQLPYYTDGNGLDAKANFSSLAHITKTNPFSTGTAGQSTLDYTTLARVGMQWELVCDMQGAGKYKYDHSGTSLDSGDGKFNDLDLLDITDAGTVANHLGTQYIFPGANVANWIGNLGGDNGEVLKSGTIPWTHLASADARELYGKNSTYWMVQNSAKIPRFCKLRTYFAEDAKKDRERAWQRADARYIVKWSVEEDSPE